MGLMLGICFMCHQSASLSCLNTTDKKYDSPKTKPLFIQTYFSQHTLLLQSACKILKWWCVSSYLNGRCTDVCSLRRLIKGIVHFEIKIWYLSAYPKGIQDVGVFFSSVDPILMFLGQTVLVCQSYNGRYRSLSL